MDYLNQLSDNIKLRPQESKVSWIILAIATLIAIISQIGIVFFPVLIIIHSAYLIESEHKAYVKRKVQFYTIIYNMLNERGIDRDKLTLFKEKIAALEKQIRKFIITKQTIGAASPAILFSVIIYIAILVMDNPDSDQIIEDTTFEMFIFSIIVLVFYIIFHVAETLPCTKVWVKIYKQEKDVVKTLSDILQEQNVIEKEIKCNIDVALNGINDSLIVVVSLISFGYIWLYATYSKGKTYLRKIYAVEDNIVDALKKL